MRQIAGDVFRKLAERQHGVAAVWQLLQRHVPRTAVDAWLRAERPARLHRGVYGDGSGWGRVMAAALAHGPLAVVGGGAGVAAWGMRPLLDGAVDVMIPGLGRRRPRRGIVVHRSLHVDAMTTDGIPVLSPTRCLRDWEAPRHVRFRALEQAEALRLDVDLGALTSPLWGEVLELIALGMNATRSDAEARFLFLCRDHGIAMPVVNHRLNGVEADFHWPAVRLVVEVDGFEFHKSRVQFEEDRRRGLVHRAAGFEVVRISAHQVQHAPGAIVAALRSVL